MAFAAVLGKAGFNPKRVSTKAKVHLDKVGEGFKVTKIDLATEAEVPEIDEAAFQEAANGAKTGCPISQLLSGGAEINLEAKLLQ